MHKLYLKASYGVHVFFDIHTLLTSIDYFRKTVAPAAHGLSKEQILKRINFAAFAASGNSDDDGGAPNAADISD